MHRILPWLIRHWVLSSAVLLLACGALGYSLAAPPPPREVRIAVGTAPDSAYTLAAEAYARRLEETAFRVRRVPTQGSVENLAMLRAREVDLALVQGGIADPARDAGLVSLGAVFHEPAWIFLRAEAGIGRVSDLRGRRVAIGPEGSGTRVLALALLAANDIGPLEIEALPITGTAAAEAMLAGAADAAILVSARTAGAVATLMRAAPAVRLVDVADSADAYGVHLPFLSAVRLPRGGLSLAADQPEQSVTLLAPVASVLAHQDIHPQVVSLLVGIMQEVHRPRTLFSAEGSFPNALAQDLPMNADAERYYARGRTVLQRWLPFWVAVWVERLFFVLLPVIGLAVPLIRFGPTLYAWQMEGRVWRHYDTLRRIEAEAEQARGDDARAALRERLEALEGRVARLSLPLTYRRHVFALRRDIAYVRAQLAPTRRPGGIEQA
ncbi:ABC transporter substrate-binding protein [Roseomonas sp. PWR1]|uniref:ABC transporter substrate-binding protein n=1 Tax=Roseomonas nitratireducens TaxID=2820810 RepID=A0ABS4AQ29_9PROT|nr:TAXI family TRAP transporter solute-binding subunit [Neoroseomonas nitratireducens]MBP0463463.1 ABC transporter substrate-binding protein [Neoroseomonas nitratireducens]